MPSALGVDIFAGGFTVGVNKHFDVLAHFEEGPYGVATAKLNFPDLPIFVGHSDWPVADPKFFEPDFLYGNPPCAAWSQANGRPMDNWRTDHRVDCTRRHFELLEKLHPKVWVWESVARTFVLGREFVDQLAAAAVAQGYAVTLFLHDGQYFGIPQRRKRFFFVAHRIKLNLEAPDWSTETCGEALRKINDIGPMHREAQTYTDRNAWLLPHCIPGEDLRRTFNRMMGDDDSKMEKNAHGQVKGRPPFLVKRSHPDEVAFTVTADQVHPSENRFLTLREVGQLCGYPGDWELAKPANKMLEMSRGVCPPVAEYLARMVAKAVAADEPITGTPTICVVDYTKPPGHTYEVVDGPLPLQTVTIPKGIKVKDEIFYSSENNPSPPAATRQRDASSAPTATRHESPHVVTLEPAKRVTVGIPKPKPGVKRMVFLQVLIMMDRWTPSQMVEIVKSHWSESKVSSADVSTQRAVLREKGYSVPATRRQAAELLPWA